MEKVKKVAAFPTSVPITGDSLTPAQEARCLADLNTDISTPISAIKVAAAAAENI